MNRRKTLLTTSALTLVFGVAPASYWIYRHKLTGAKRSSRELPLAGAQVVSAASAPRSQDDANPLDKIFTKEPRLSYKGYVVERVEQKQEGFWFATLKKGEKVLASFEEGGEQDYWTNFGLANFLGGDSKQLIVEQYSGGAHCCYSYWVYDLSATARPVFASGKYGTGNSLVPLDVDGDGLFELRHSVMTFDYFHTSHASSVFPEALFAYDKRSGEYRPANRRFQDYILRDIKDDFKEFETVKAAGRDEEGEDIYAEKYFSAVLQVTLKYIYAGKPDEGWAFFDKQYRTHQGISKEKMKAEITEQLAGEPVYAYIYSQDGK